MASEYSNECEIRMKWKIREEDARNVDEFGCIESNRFASNIPGVKYSLEFYPHGNDDEAEKVWIFLYLDFEHSKKIIADCSFNIESADNESSLNDQIFDAAAGWGQEICIRDELFDPAKSYFVNGILTIELEGTLKSQGVKRPLPSDPLSLGEYLWENKSSKDFTICVEKKELKIHKWVLSAKSPVFKAAVESGLKETIENTMTIPDFAYATVLIAVKYCYEKDIRHKITESNASELLHFSDMYNIEALHETIQIELIKIISMANVCTFANISVTSNAAELQEHCICFLINNASEDIPEITNLKMEITSEIGRRSFLPVS